MSQTWRPEVCVCVCVCFSLSPTYPFVCFFSCWWTLLGARKAPLNSAKHRLCFSFSLDPLPPPHEMLRPKKRFCTRLFSVFFSNQTLDFVFLFCPHKTPTQSTAGVHPHVLEQKRMMRWRLFRPIVAKSSVQIPRLLIYLKTGLCDSDTGNHLLLHSYKLFSSLAYIYREPVVQTPM